MLGLLGLPRYHRRTITGILFHTGRFFYQVQYVVVRVVAAGVVVMAVRSVVAVVVVVWYFVV